MNIYIGPGVGLATIIVVLLVSFLVFASLCYVLWRPLKKIFSSFMKTSSQDKSEVD